MTASFTIHLAPTTLLTSVAAAESLSRRGFGAEDVPSPLQVLPEAPALLEDPPMVLGSKVPWRWTGPQNSASGLEATNG